ncbi:hypothetical protein ACFQZZ_07600 [Nocardia sp. GCM10030253]|uniref:hypothetical protein n=1 Tax=Nocardia sp. GCM10030253 TaxID=3273404 RepID=UPI0036454119
MRGPAWQNLVLDGQAPPVGVIETLTGSPFGAQLEGGVIPFFDPRGWHPEIGVDAAIELLGWSCVRSDGGSPAAALERLRVTCRQGPVLVGPLDLGLMRYRPGSGAAIGADHYVVVLAVEQDTVVLHDPQGHPFATLPSADFLDAWRAEKVTYVDTPFVMRSGFIREQVFSLTESLESSIPRAIEWLGGASDAVEGLGDLVASGLDPEVRNLLAIFGVRLGSRRLLDASACLAMLDRADAAAIAAAQARVLGGLQYSLVANDDATLISGLRRLAPEYDRLRGALARSWGSGSNRRKNNGYGVGPGQGCRVEAAVRGGYWSC